MNAWRKGREFISMLERKQYILQRDIAQTLCGIERIKDHIAQHYEEHAGINQEIKRLTPSGILSKNDIYQGIRRQGTLLSHQQLIIQKINQLEEEKFTQEEKLQQYRSAMNVLDKRHYKIDNYLQKIRCSHLRRKENNVENEIQEMAGYVR